MIDKTKLKRELEQRGWVQVYSHPGSPWKFMWDATNQESPVVELIDSSIFYTRGDYDETHKKIKPKTDLYDSVEELLSNLD